MSNALYYGDNLGYLRDMPSGSIDLIYLDPPFNSNATYNLLFKTPHGEAVQAQTAAFRDTWSWDTPAETAYDDVIASGSPAAPTLVAFRRFMGESDMMAYLSMMAVRLIEMHRILKETGSLFLHCDPTASHYLKVLLDGMFGGTNYRNEIVWKRTTSHNDATRRFGDVHDCILYYAKDNLFTFRRQFTSYNADYLKNKYRHKDADGRVYRLSDLRSPSPRPNLTYDYKGHKPHPNGWAVSRDKMEELDQQGRLEMPRTQGGRIQLRRYLDELKGMPVSSLWDDIRPVNAMARERLGYPTQKPRALLDRILSCSTQPGQVVLDPFCGCGTTIESAEALGRSWIGIDITHHAVDVIESRMKERCPDANFQVLGRPEDLASAWDLARRNKYEFQWWANWLVGVQNYRERKKGADRGIDGVIYFKNGPHGVGQTIISVKGGDNIGPDMIAALAGTVQRENAQMGLFVCIAEPTKRMRQDAAAAGIVDTAQGKFQRIQIATISDLLDGKRPQMPRPIETEAFRQPLRITRPTRTPRPDAQLSLILPIVGGRTSSRDVQDHLAGSVIGRIALSAK